jgi:hypothetical protein
MENNIKNRFRGWSNYATFRVFDDVLRGFDFDDKVSAEEVKEIALESIFEGYQIHTGSHLVEEYARTIMNLVDFEEIAETINADIKNIR